jgi:hypothetical protein
MRSFPFLLHQTKGEKALKQIFIFTDQSKTNSFLSFWSASIKKMMLFDTLKFYFNFDFDFTWPLSFSLLRDLNNNIRRRTVIFTVRESQLVKSCRVELWLSKWIFTWRKTKGLRISTLCTRLTNNSAISDSYLVKLLFSC